MVYFALTSRGSVSKLYTSWSLVKSSVYQKCLSLETQFADPFKAGTKRQLGCLCVRALKVASLCCVWIYVYRYVYNLLPRMNTSLSRLLLGARHSDAVAFAKARAWARIKIDHIKYHFAVVLSTPRTHTWTSKTFVSCSEGFVREALRPARSKVKETFDWGSHSPRFLTFLPIHEAQGFVTLLCLFGMLVFAKLGGNLSPFRRDLARAFLWVCLKDSSNRRSLYRKRAARTCKFDAHPVLTLSWRNYSFFPASASRTSKLGVLLATFRAYFVVRFTTRFITKA